VTTPAPILVYATTTCSDCHRTRFYLDQHRVEYTWINIENDPAGEALVRRLNGGLRRVPTVILPDGSYLAEPTNEELDARLNP
jgi:glutaredoxin